MRLSRLLTFVLAAAPLSTALADETHFRPYLLGSKAAGMGGAFTALSDDASGSYYNPGGLAFSRRSSVSLTGSVYGLAQARYVRAIGDQDLTASDVQVFPVSTAGLLKFGSPQADGISNHTFAFGVFVPDASDNVARAELGSDENVLIIDAESQTLWGGVGYAYRYGNFGFGAMIYALQGTNEAFFDLAAYNPEVPSAFFNVTARLESTWFGALAGAGVRWNASESLSVGASVFSPAVGFGSRATYVRVNYGQNSGTLDGSPVQGVDAAEDLESGPAVPLRAQAGIAFSRPRWTVSADAIFLAPLERTFDEGTDYEIGVDRRPVLNASLGGEFLLTPQWPLRAGLFTDFSAATSPEELIGTVDGDKDAYDVNRYGASLSISYRSQHVVTDLGVNASVGSGQDYQPLFNTEAPLEARQRLLYVFLATTYEF